MAVTELSLAQQKELQQQFLQQGFCVVPALLSAELSAFLAEYAVLKRATKPNIYRNKSDTLSQIHREYADPAMEVLLARLHVWVELFTGMSLWPTLSFYYTYANGNELKKHKDRECCEVVACACLGLDPEYQKSKQHWPIYVETLQGEAYPVCLNPGDVVLFKGSQLHHWREAFDGKWCVSAIFAYVDRQGENAFLKYDQRRALGHKHVGMLFWLLRLGWFRLRAWCGRLGR